MVMPPVTMLTLHEYEDTDTDAGRDQQLLDEDGGFVPARRAGEGFNFTGAAETTFMR